MVLMMFGPYNTVSWVLGPLGLGLFGQRHFRGERSDFLQGGQGPLCSLDGQSRVVAQMARIHCVER